MPAERGVDPTAGGLVAAYNTWTRIPADGGGIRQVRKGEKALWVWAPLVATRGCRSCSPATAPRNGCGRRSSPSHRQPQRLKTLAHEGAHVALDHAERTVGPRCQVAEVEAESVADLLMATVGIDAAQYTIPYVSGWASGDVELVKATAERGLATTARPLGRIEDRLHVDLNPDPLRPPEPEATVTALRPSAVAAAVLPDLDPVADQAAGRIDLDGARRRLVSPDAAERIQLPTAERVAVLLAAAGADVADAIATTHQLGLQDPDIHDALTAVVSYETVDRAPEPLYDPSDVTRALGGWLAEHATLHHRDEPFAPG